MADVRAMLKRVQRLEAGRAPMRSPFEAQFGSVEGFETHVQELVDVRALDRIDMDGVLAAVRRWHNDRAYDLWQRSRRIVGGWQ